MKKKVFMLMLVGLFFLGTSGYVYSAGVNDAKVMVEKAISFYKANGKSKTIEEIKNPKGKFIKGQLYVNVYNLQGVMLANPVNKKLIGMNGSGLQDPDGKFFMKELLERAAKEGSGWVDYRWTNPVTKKIEPKTTYFKQVDDIIMACGIYKK